jgi:hypothetical protein
MRDPILLLALHIAVPDDAAVVARVGRRGSRAHYANGEDGAHLLPGVQLVGHDALLIPGVSIGPQLQKEAADFDCAPLGRKMQGCVAIVIAAVDAGS